LSERQYEHRARASGGRLPWTYNLGLSVTYLKSFSEVDLRAKFAIYNVLDQQRKTQVDDELESDIGFINPGYLQGTSFQSPRYAQFLVTIDF
jgi:hypothetical protein